MNEILETLFDLRNLHTEQERKDFLEPNFESQVHNPYVLSDMEKAIARIRLAVENKETIGIYTDYDCDGIPGAVITHDFLTKIGHENFVVYIPDRQNDGYGLSNAGIDFLHEKGATLIITIDLGITGHDNVLYATEKGIDIIITDHHLPHATLPEAFAIINPKKDGDIYPFKELCGTGVMYKVICAYLEKYREIHAVQKGWEKWLLDMVGLATLADMVQLVGENRVFAWYGLLVTKKTKRLGLKKILQMNMVNLDRLSEDDLTFTLVPRINASSRMGSAYLAYNMLIATDVSEAENYAKELENMNKKRKAHVAAIMKEVYKMKSDIFEDDIIVIGDPNWRPGVLGLVAGKLVDIYQKPVFVWGGSDEADVEILKGSCRGPVGSHMVDMMTFSKEVFTHFGGHDQAGGFAVTKRTVHDLKTSLINSFEIVKKQVAIQELQEEVDGQKDEMFITVIPNKELFTTIEQFAPFGIGNPKPVLKFENTSIVSFRQFGKIPEHFEAIFKIGNTEIKGIAFFKNQDSFSGKIEEGKEITLLATLEMSYFIRPELRLKILDIL